MKTDEEKCIKEFSQLTPQLFLASAIAITDEDLKKNNINLIINATEELEMYLSSWIHTIRVPVADDVQASLYPYFKPICELIQANEKKRGSTLIHCVYGKSRSSTLCISYLLWVDYCKKQKCNFHEILEYVQKKRSIVQPNVAFVDQLVQWESCLNENKKYFDPRLLNEEEENAILTIVELSKKMSIK